MLLKPNMLDSGQESSRRASVQEVAIATLRCFRRHVPVSVQGIVFLSGGQEERVATVGGRTGGGWQLGSSPRVG
jgi:fructose-bisphosphate aldolase class I